MLEEIKTEQKVVLNFSFVCTICTILYMKTNENYGSTDRPNVTPGQIACNLETKHLHCRAPILILLGVEVPVICSAITILIMTSAADCQIVAQWS